MKIFRNRTVIGVLCILLALIICFGVTPMFSRSASEKAEIVRVTADIKEGDEITAEMVQAVEVGAYNLPQNIMTDKNEVIGKYATADLKVGDYILASKLSTVPAAENAYLYNLDGTKKAISVTIKSFATGLSGKLAARLPMWEPALGAQQFDPRVDADMLTREGARRVAAFFRKHGTGLFASCPGSTWVGVSEKYPLGLRGITKPDPIRLEDMVLYEKERGTLVENTRRLLAGHQACNILLYGDKGTGKSATVKALLSSMWLDGLRIVEVPLAHLTNLPTIFSILREQPGKFIVFVDDLAFSDSCPEYTALKTVLEGGLEARPENVVVYATSNRRNIVRQRFSERQDDVNERDTLEEKFSLADRFDLRLTFKAPTQEEYFTICRALLDARGLSYDWETLMPRARAWTVSHNGCSPRIARQFVDLIEGEMAQEQA